MGCLSLLMCRVSQILPHSWWGVPPPPQGLDLWRIMEAANQLDLPLLGCGEGPQRPDPWQVVGETLLHPLLRGGDVSDGYSTVSEVPGGQHRRRRHRNEKHLTLACLDMPIFKPTEPNVDVTYTLWRFDVQGLLDQYDEASMIPHIFLSLQGYPSKWACSLPEGRDIFM